MTYPNTELVTPEWIKTRRTAKGWTQQELADRIGCPVNTIKTYESGRRDPRGPAKAALWYALHE